MFYKIDLFCHLIIICHLNSIQLALEGLRFTSYKFQQLTLQEFFENLRNANILQ